MSPVAEYVEASESLQRNETVLENRAWNSELGTYAHFDAITFENAESMKEGMKVFFFNDQIRTAPVRALDALTVVVPREVSAIWAPALDTSGLRPHIAPVTNIFDLPDKEADRVRKKAGFIYA